MVLTAIEPGDQPMSPHPIRVLQVFRSPVGGLFRHVRDLVRGLSEMGHEVGIACDSLTGGESAERELERARRYCALGIHRLPMSRLPGLGDIVSAKTIEAQCRGLAPQIVHGHGAKGGAYARITAGALGAQAVYTPHGGSLHFTWRSAQGALFLSAERLLRRRTSGLLFVCEYERRVFAEKVGLGEVPNAVVHNGLWPEEFEPVLPAPSAKDVLFVGELRWLKGVDVLIDALAALRDRGQRLTANIVGSGGDRPQFEAQAARLGLSEAVRFLGPMPAHEALALGRVLVVPSRAESLPYIVLEAAAAGVPVLASRVGGIGEILPSDRLVESGDAKALADAIGRSVLEREAFALDAASDSERIERRFSVGGMVEGVRAFYQRLLDRGSR